MARMIPPIVPSEYRGEGEREIFRRLRDDPNTRNWIVLHSLGLAKHERQVAGEIDFVIIIPAKGVLCLEVKGCSTSHLRRENGLWFYGPHDKGDSRGPFRQANDAMHSLRRRLVEDRPDLATVQLSSGVVFPFAEFRVQSPEWNEWEVIDCIALRSVPISQLAVQLMDSARGHLLRAPGRPRIDTNAPSARQSQIIRDQLRGDFDLPVDAKARAGALESELRHYTTEQLLALDAMADNPRTIFVGPAGTGKTVLAVESVRRAHAVGSRVLVVCFNRLLGSSLEKQVIDLTPDVVAGTLHRRLLSISGLKQAPDDADRGFWEDRLPRLACQRLASELADGVSANQFDELVVDEAQDILREPYLDFLDLSTKGGLAAGRWRIFGDFENQAIYGTARLPLEEFRRRRTGDAPILRLRVNCRNTPLIAEWVHLLAGLDPPYSRVLRPDDGIQPELRFYSDSSRQQDLLTLALEELERAGYEAPEIVVLSNRSERSSAAATMTIAPWKDRLCSLERPLRGRVPFGSIHGFKGLEAPAVIITDVETIVTPASRALLYVAFTRALQRLIVLAYERVRGEALSILGTEAAGQLGGV